MKKPPSGVPGGRLRTSLLILLIPGLSFKRWLAIGGLALFATTIGIIFALKVSTAPAFISFLENVSLRGESAYIRGAVFIGIGVIGASIGMIGLLRSLRQVGQRTRHRNFLDSMYVERVLGSGPKITLIGGGSGMPSLLRGMKHYTSNITAIVTMADDGGSSGRLRNELGIQPPGDIRNCLVALADSEDVMQQLMDYRFSSNGQLDGHSFGNMLIAALAGIGGDFSRGVEVAGELLAIRGRVIPSTATDVTLVASTAGGETLIGESNIAMATDRLRSLTLVPPDPKAHPDAVAAIREADLIVIGPGSLFTSIVPNLLIGQISRALSESTAFKVYVCNVAEEPRQTEGFSVKDHLNIVRHYGGSRSVNAVIANNNIPEGITPAGLNFIEEAKNWDEDVWLVETDLIDDVMTARHDSGKISWSIVQAYNKYRGHRRRFPRVHFNISLNRTAGKESGSNSFAQVEPVPTDNLVGRP